jgi:hypothetical protein
MRGSTQCSWSTSDNRESQNRARPSEQSLLLIGLVGATATATGFPAASKLPLAVWRGWPTAAALFSFCFSGHAVSAGLGHRLHLNLAGSAAVA